MNEVQKLEAKGYRRDRKFKTELQAKDYKKRIEIGGKKAEIVQEENDSNYLVMTSSKAATTTQSTAIQIKQLPSGLTWNEFVGKNLSAYKLTLDHKSAMQRLSQEWKAYKKL